MIEPKIRFKKDDGSQYPNLEKMIIKDVMKERHELRILSDDLPQLSFTIEEGVILPEDKKTNKRDFLIKDKTTKKYAVTELNDIIYNPANIKFGAIHRNKLGRGGVSPIYAIFEPLEDPKYLELYVQRKSFIRKSMRFLEGTVEKLKSLKPNDFIKLEINLPCKEEQAKIVGFFEYINDVISTGEEEVKQLENLKKGVIQKIFSQEIRFKDDNGNDFEEWKEKKLGECLKYEQPSKYLVKSEDYKGCTKYPVLTANKGFLLGYTDEETGIYNKGKVIIFDDFTCDSKFVNFDFKVKSSAIKMLTPIDPDDSLECLHAILVNLNFQPESHQRHWISIMAEQDVLVPCKEEQRKISELINSMNVAIDTAREELELYKNLKKGLLQQMFI